MKDNNRILAVYLSEFSRIKEGFRSGLGRQLDSLFSYGVVQLIRVGRLC